MAHLSKYLLERDSIVMRLVFCAIDKRHRSFARKLTHMIKRLARARGGLEFKTVTPDKMRPTGRLVPEPGAKFGAWRNVFEPKID